mmetsp:Transcript_49824/g.81946  ORF Transcript_49824/g.81946 Transcript_49824/m.81946 type:complete len:209 (+) Transcript_49824:606-1232(+)
MLGVLLRANTQVRHVQPELQQLGRAQALQREALDDLGRDVFGRRSQTFGLHHRVDPIFQALGRTLDAFQPEPLLHGIGALIHQLIFPGVQATLALPTCHGSLSAQFDVQQSHLIESLSQVFQQENQAVAPLLIFGIDTLQSRHPRTGHGHLGEGGPWLAVLGGRLELGVKLQLVTGMCKVFPDEKVHRNSLWGSLLAISETIKRSSAT